jgi:hypothetical protein
MKTKSLLGLAMAAALLVGTAGVVVAQDAEGEVDVEAVSFTGCLVEVEEDEYVLQDAESGEEMVVMGDAVGGHAGHKVTITGVWAQDEAGDEYFEVDVVEHLDTSCD